MANQRLPQPSRRVHNVKLQFPPLPPEWAEKYKPGQMHRYRDSLLKLPVPPLQQTLEKYGTCLEVSTTCTRVIVSDVNYKGNMGYTSVD